MHKTFITGTTGFIGKEVLKKLLEDQTDSHFYLLVRGNSHGTAKERFQKIVDEIQQEAVFSNVVLEQRLHLIEGDITLERLGIPINDYNVLAEKIDTIYHIAASVQLNDPIEVSRNINVGGTRNMLTLTELANEKNDFQRFNYVSTAYVAGKRDGKIYEKDLNKGQGFNNNYEQAKMEAELVIEEYKKRLPICVYRPSIVVGDSKTGWTNSFNVLYAPLKMLNRGDLDLMPCSSESKMDVVPIDYVVEAIAYLSQLGAEINGKTFHISAGKDNGISTIDLFHLSMNNLAKYRKVYNRPEPKKLAKPVSPTMFKILFKIIRLFVGAKKKQKMDRLLTYASHTFEYKVFDNSEAAKYLEPAGIKSPNLAEYMEVICEFAIRENFGRPLKKNNKVENKKAKVPS